MGCGRREQRSGYSGPPAVEMVRAGITVRVLDSTTMGDTVVLSLLTLEILVSSLVHPRSTDIS